MTDLSFEDFLCGVARQPSKDAASLIPSHTIRVLLVRHWGESFKDTLYSLSTFCRAFKGSKIYIAWESANLTEEEGISLGRSYSSIVNDPTKTRIEAIEAKIPESNSPREKYRFGLLKGMRDIALFQSLTLEVGLIGLSGEKDALNTDQTFKLISRIPAMSSSSVKNLGNSPNDFIQKCCVLYESHVQKTVKADLRESNDRMINQLLKLRREIDPKTPIVAIIGSLHAEVAWKLLQTSPSAFYEYASLPYNYVSAMGHLATYTLYGDLIVEAAMKLALGKSIKEEDYRDMLLADLISSSLAMCAGVAEEILSPNYSFLAKWEVLLDLSTIFLKSITVEARCSLLDSIFQLLYTHPVERSVRACSFEVLARRAPELQLTPFNWPFPPEPEECKRILEGVFHQGIEGFANR